MKDWTGNQRSIFSCLGARNFAEEDREENDYYATHPDAAEWLVKLENLSSHVWECACGEGHISKVLETHGIEVLSTDLIDRKFGVGGGRFPSTKSRVSRRYYYKPTLQIRTGIY